MIDERYDWYRAAFVRFLMGSDGYQELLCIQLMMFTIMKDERFMEVRCIQLIDN